MKKKIGYFFNFDKLGGAEKSLINTLTDFMVDYDVEAFVPSFSIDEKQTEIGKTLLERDINHSEYYFPLYLYRFSLKQILKILLSPIEVITFFKILLSMIKSSDIIWLNGTRIGLFILLLMRFQFSNKKVLWHCRDYPRRNSLLIRLMTILTKNLDFYFICNSESVNNAFSKCFNTNDTLTLYNQVENLSIENKKTSKVETIGLVGNLVDWKGFHQVCLMAQIYKKELASLGVKKILIYGDFIYQLGTADFKSSLLEYCDDSFIIYKGRKEPSEIFSSIDLLIHSSINPEPFGRVVLEGFKNNIPVISTNLGGVRELLGETRGSSFKPFDYFDLFSKIRELVLNNELRQSHVKKAFSFYKDIDKLIMKQNEKIKNLF